MITNKSGSVVKEKTYEAFRNLVWQSGTYSDNREFTSKEKDPTGFHYFPFRYYSADIGRFLSPDPHTLYPKNLKLANPQTLNPYVYCHNNPVNFFDPDGKYEEVLVAIATTSQWCWTIPTPVTYGIAILGGAYMAYVTAELVNEKSRTTEGIYDAITGAAKAEAKENEKTGSKETEQARRRGVEKAWEKERELVKTGKGTRRWTEAEKKELLKTGKVKGYEGHHIKSVKDNPELADDPTNIEFLTRDEHFEEHDFNWQNPTWGDEINR
jgi:RHS repeat-associated protein